MTFKVNASALIAYVAELRNSYDDVAMAENYVHVHGNFSFHEAGIIGKLAGQHAGLMSQLDELHNQLELILWRSGEALTQAASDYTDIDEKTAAQIDASYPAVLRPAPRRD